VSELSDRRARKKAQTRALVRQTAQDLFARRGFEAVTIADIAAAADVAVQTVFNHFATKEDLFFDGRTPWVQGPAQAVRTRALGTSALDALQDYLTERVGGQVSYLATPEGRSYVSTLEASPALTARERDLHQEATSQLTDALLEAWTRGDAAPVVPTDLHTTASLTAAVWLAALRTLVGEQRRACTGAPGDPERRATAACDLAGRVFDSLAGALERAAEAPLRPTG
jgi:AcrR family transcriptional regulator